MNNKFRGFSAAGFAFFIIGAAGIASLTMPEHEHNPTNAKIAAAKVKAKSMGADVVVLGTGKIANLKKMSEASLARTTCGVGMEMFSTPEDQQRIGFAMLLTAVLMGCASFALLKDLLTQFIELRSAMRERLEAEERAMELTKRLAAGQVRKSAHAGFSINRDYTPVNVCRSSGEAPARSIRKLRELINDTNSRSL